MATAASSDMSIEQAMAIVERWNQVGPTDQEKTEFAKDINKAVSNAGYADKLNEEIRALKIRAEKIDKDFTQFQNDMDAFLQQYGDQKPGIKDFRTEWSEHKANWKFLFSASQEYAARAAVDYEKFGALLKEATQVHTGYVLHKLAFSMRAYAKGIPVDLHIDFQKKASQLIHNVDDFQRTYHTYVNDQTTGINEQGKTLIQQINALKEEITQLNAQIIQTSSNLGFTPLLGLVGVALAGTVLGKLVAKRAERQQDLDALANQSKSIELSGLPLGLVRMDLLLAGLVPELSPVVQSFILFPNLWNELQTYAATFAAVLEQAETPEDLPPMIKAQIDMTLAASDALVHSLKDYAGTN